MADKIGYNRKLCIATPFYDRRACSDYVMALVNTVRVLEKTGIDFDIITAGDSYVGRARNAICHRFLKSDCDDLFFIDSDESWDVEGFFRILMLPFDVVGGVYKMKNGWDRWTANFAKQGNQLLGKMLGPDTAIVKANFIPCGFMRLRRQALESFRDAYPTLRYIDECQDGESITQFFECSVINGVYTGEDASFCYHWGAMGGEIWVEPNVTITHFGMTGWEGNFAKEMKGEKREAAHV